MNTFLQLIINNIYVKNLSCHVLVQTLLNKTRQNRLKRSANNCAGVKRQARQWGQEEKLHNEVRTVSVNNYVIACEGYCDCQSKIWVD